MYMISYAHLRYFSENLLLLYLSLNRVYRTECQEERIIRTHHEAHSLGATPYLDHWLEAALDILCLKAQALVRSALRALAGGISRLVPFLAPTILTCNYQEVRRCHGLPTFLALPSAREPYPAVHCKYSSSASCGRGVARGKYHQYSSLLPYDLLKSEYMIADVVACLPAHSQGNGASWWMINNDESKPWTFVESQVYTVLPLCDQHLPRGILSTAYSCWTGLAS